jgi:Cytochrome c3
VRPLSLQPGHFLFSRDAWRYAFFGVAGALLVLLFGALATTGSKAQSRDAEKPSLDSKATNCAGCHGTRSPLPRSHPAVVGYSLTQCRSCHAEGTAKSLVQKMPLWHLHQLSGVTCVTCHDKPSFFDPVAATRCMSCHTPDRIAADTAKVKPANPHDSHYGRQLDCNYCHHAHSKSEDACAQCHKFNFTVP